MPIGKARITNIKLEFLPHITYYQAYCSLYQALLLQLGILDGFTGLPLPVFKLMLYFCAILNCGS